MTTPDSLPLIPTLITAGILWIILLWPRRR